MTKFSRLCCWNLVARIYLLEFTYSNKHGIGNRTRFLKQRDKIRLRNLWPTAVDGREFYHCETPNGPAIMPRVPVFQALLNRESTLNQPPDQALSDTALLKYFRSAKFLQSAATLAQCPTESGTEIAFVGRSNAGKSSALNKLTDNNKLAKTGKTPGRTQLINFFELSDGNRLVDLPGYGYAKVSRSKKVQWQQHLLDYLSERPSLKAIVLVMDIRHPLQPFDEMMLEWVEQYDMPCLVLATKCDKLSRNEAQKSRFSIENRLKRIAASNCILFSCQSSMGLNEARSSIFQQLSI